MQNNINLKLIASVALLVLIIGIMSRAQTAARSLGSKDWSMTATAPASNIHHGIDSSFFDFGQPSGAPVKKLQTLIQQSVPAPSYQFNPFFAQNVNTQAQAPEDVITADSYLVGNLVTGKIYFEKDPTTVRPIASISKLFAALVAKKRMNLNAIVTVASSSITGYDATNSPSTIIPGESFGVGDILEGMLLVSSNDAATTLADNYANVTGDPNPDSRANFVSLMNATAAFIGMTNTSFKDPSGLSSGNVSSAEDLFKFARYLYSNGQDILALTKTPKYDIATTTDHRAHTFVNIDPFVYDTHYLGGKTGRTDAAGETMMSLFNIPVGGISYPIAIIVLHSSQDTRQIDSSILVGRVISALSR